MHRFTNLPDGRVADSKFNPAASQCRGASGHHEIPLKVGFGPLARSQAASGAAEIHAINQSARLDW